MIELESAKRTEAAACTMSELCGVSRANMNVATISLRSCHANNFS